MEDDRRGELVFRLLVLFTLILLSRPQDLFPVLRPIPIAQLVAAPAIFFCFLALFTRQFKFQFPIELKIMFGLTVWFALGIPFAFWRYNSLQMFRDDWLKTICIFFLLTQTLVCERRVRVILWALFISALIATGSSLVFGGASLNNALETDARYMGLTKGFFGGNYLGIASAITIPYLAAILVHTRSLFKTVLLFCAFGTMAAMAVITASRSNIICVVISLGLTWLVLLRDSIKSLALSLVFVIGVTIAIMAAPGTFWERIGTLWNDEYATNATADSAVDSQLQRKELLLDSIRYTIQNPIFGLGMGNFQIFHGTEAHNSQEWKGTHNTFTEISSEAGIPALGMFLFLFVTVFKRVLWIARKCGKRPELALVKLMARATLVAVISTMLGGFFAHVAYFSFVYYVPAIAVGLQIVLDRHLAGDQLIAQREGRIVGDRFANGLAESEA